MNRELSLTIRFSRPLDTEEQNLFWDELVGWLEQHSLRAGGGDYPDKLDWVIDCNHTSLPLDEVIRLLTEFLEGKRDRITTYHLEPLRD